MKIGIVITVRTGSSRLPQKALLPVAGEPIIGYLIERIKYWNEKHADIYICTTHNKEDLVLKSIADTFKIGYFQGDPENIPKRHLECMIANNLDFIVNVDGDDILCNPEYIEKIIEFYKLNPEYDVVKTKDLPFGTNSMGYTRSVLESIVHSQNTVKIDTGWGELVNDANLFKTFIFEALQEEQIDARLTLDYDDDFKFFKSIIENNLAEIKIMKHKNLVAYLRCNPSIININYHLNEQYWQNYHSHKESEGR